MNTGNLPTVHFDGVDRVLAAIPSPQMALAAFPKFCNMGVAPLDPSQWQEIDMSWYDNPIWDQGMSSSCVGQATTAGMETVNKQMGRPALEFNPYFVYAFINGGRDAGSMISDALKSLQANGTCLKGDMPNQVAFQNQLPAQAIQNAQRYRLAMAYHCESFEDICSALTLGFVCPLGIYVDNNFVNLDNEGIAGLPAGGQGGGHAILGCGLKKSASHGWLIKIQNSWGPRYGMKGYSYIHKGHFQKMHPDAFAIQMLIDDPKDNTPEDEVPVVIP